MKKIFNITLIDSKDIYVLLISEINEDKIFVYEKDGKHISLYRELSDDEDNKKILLQNTFQSEDGLYHYNGRLLLIHNNQKEEILSYLKQTYTIEKENDDDYIIENKALSLRVSFYKINNSIYNLREYVHENEKKILEHIDKSNVSITSSMHTGFLCYVSPDDKIKKLSRNGKSMQTLMINEKYSLGRHKKIINSNNVLFVATNSNWANEHKLIFEVNLDKYTDKEILKGSYPTVVNDGIGFGTLLPQDNKNTFFDGEVSYTIAYILHNSPPTGDHHISINFTDRMSVNITVRFFDTDKHTTEELIKSNTHYSLLLKSLRGGKNSFIIPYVNTKEDFHL